MTFVSDIPFPDPLETFRYGLSMRRKRLRSSRAHATAKSCLSSQLQEWSVSSSSSLTLVKGTFQSRFDVKGFCIERVNTLQVAKLHVLWALKMTGEEAMQSISDVDLLKYLILQALRLSSTLQTEGSMALSCRRFQSATTEKEWFDLLGSVLASISSDVYLIIDLETLGPGWSSSHQEVSWPKLFLDLFQKLSSHGVHTRIKVILATYGSAVLRTSQDVPKPMLQMKSRRSRRVTRRAKSATPLVLYTAASGGQCESSCLSTRLDAIMRS